MKKLISLLLVLVSLPSFARSFDIEVIIFERTADPEQTQEAWPQNLPVINYDKSSSYRNKTFMSAHGAHLLPSSSYAMNNQYHALERHAGFEPLVHVAWRQADKGPNAAPIFHIRAGENFADQFIADGRSKAELDQTTLDNLPPQPRGLYQLEGTMQVYVQHYLFVETDLDVRIPGKNEVILPDPVVVLDDEESQATVQTGNLEEIKPKVEIQEFLNSYRMKQKRQMRSGETHYLDHPLLGMIIQVRRVEE